jgi:lipid-A-disaccharide synthase
MLIKVPYISLVNLIAQKEVVKELIQDDFNAENLQIELSKILNQTTYKDKILSDYQSIKEILNKPNPSENAGNDIVLELKKTK